MTHRRNSPYIARIEKGTRKNPNYNPFDFNKNKQIRNFDPRSIVLPFELRLRDVTSNGVLVSDSGIICVQGIVGVFARQSTELKYGQIDHYSEPVGITRESEKIGVTAEVVGAISIPGMSDVNVSCLISNNCRNYAGYCFDLIPKGSTGDSLTYPITYS